MDSGHAHPSTTPPGGVDLGPDCRKETYVLADGEAHDCGRSRVRWSSTRFGRKSGTELHRRRPRTAAATLDDGEVMGPGVAEFPLRACPAMDKSGSRPFPCNLERAGLMGLG